jgi:hypothetical protein
MNGGPGDLLYGGASAEPVPLTALRGTTIQARALFSDPRHDSALSEPSARWPGLSSFTTAEAVR